MYGFNTGESIWWVGLNIKVNMETGVETEHG